MTFLELVQSLRQEAGIPGTGPDSVIDQTGQLKKLVDWTARSWLDIQGMNESWKFLRASFSVAAAASTASITPAAAGITDFDKWHTKTLRSYQTSVGIADEQWIFEWDYDVFRDTYLFGQQTSGRPVSFAVRDNDFALLLGPVPDVGYTITGEYQRKGVTLVADTDTPEIDSNLHMVIVWHALKKYARFEAAAESLLQANSEYADLMAKMERKYLPAIGLGDPLA